MRHSTDERSLRIRLLVSLTGAVSALLLAFAAAHYYTAPNLDGTARSNAWFELDFCLALASNLLAVGVGIHAGAVRGVRTRALSSGLSRALSWFLLTLLLGAAWASAVALLTLLIAPSHAFAGLRLAALSRAWHSARQWERSKVK
ncbi:MAG TPA: hypothetical protein VHM25_05160 [Polyangiaceae bacterium]|nr:hypothetical protein [Polyangiaceae bacterium]